VLAVLAAIVIAAVAGVALGGGGGDDDSAIADRIAVAFEELGLDPEVADCAADRVVDDLGTADLRHVDDFTAPSVPEGLSAGFPEAFAQAQAKALEGCQADADPALDG
jgi:hypothetical protein